MSSNIRIDKTCRHCGVAFTAKTTVTKFCSDRCAKLNYKKRKRREKMSQAVQKEAQHQRQAFDSALPQKPFLSVKEACALLGASRWTVYRMIEKDQLQASKLGSRTIIKREAIDNLFK